MPEITVILPVRNGANYVAESIKSVLAQDVDFELHVLDDISDDQTPDIVRGFHDRRIRYSRNPQAFGLFKTLNRGFEEAATPLVRLWAHDDRMVAGSLRKFVEFAQAHPTAGMVYSDFLEIDPDGVPTGGERVHESQRQRTPELAGSTMSALLFWFYGCLPGNISTVMLRSKSWKRVGGFLTGYQQSPDFDIWVRISEHCDVGFIREKLVELRSHPLQLAKVGQKQLTTIEEEFAVNRRLQERLLGVLTKNHLRWSFIRIRGIQHVHWVVRVAARGNLGHAMRGLRAVARYGQPVRQVAFWGLSGNGRFFVRRRELLFDAKVPLCSDIDARRGRGSRRRLKILLYGEADVPGTGAWCYAETLRELGHEVVVYHDWSELELYRHNVIARGYRRLTGAPLGMHRQRHVRGLEAIARRERPDIAVILKGLNIGPPEVVQLKRGGAWVVNINHDDFFSRNPNNWSWRQRQALPLYDYVFTTREVNIEEVRPLNHHVEFFPFAYFPRIHRPLVIPEKERDKWCVDVVFVGTWEAERARLLENLVREVPGKYAIWGGLWDRTPPWSPLRRYIRGRAVYMDDMAKALGGAKLALGFLRKDNRDDYTQRTFEIPACGGVFVAERTARHQAFFREGAEAAYFDPSSPSELIATVRALLHDPNKREALRLAGQAALRRQQHTYQDRLERLLEIYQYAQA